MTARPDADRRRPRAPVGSRPAPTGTRTCRAAWSSTWATSPGMARRFDVPTYRAESAGWNVEKLVNVAAATGRHSIDETLELDRRADADGHPDAIVGGLPPTESVAEAIGAARPADGGVPLPGRPPDGRRRRARSRPTRCSRALQERGLLFELMAHPDQLAGGGRAASPASTTSWSSSSTPAGPGRDSDEERALWTAGIDALAGARRQRASASCRAWPCRSGR